MGEGGRVVSQGSFEDMLELPGQASGGGDTSGGTVQTKRVGLRGNENDQRVSMGRRTQGRSGVLGLLCP